MALISNFLTRWGAFAAVACIMVVLAGCSESEDAGQLPDRAYQPLSAEMLALMQEKGTTQDAPVLIRTYKKEAEFEIWKMRADGRYTLLKTYPMCRWSGQLGPKVREGDRQVPEGFYAIGPAQMNPKSHYYLSFNVGYPNVYDRAHGYSGGNIMVHGICSSAGCFSMTNEQIAEIYAIARDALAAGEPAIQMQSFPFHMTVENFAKYRLDPNIAFWKELKVGSDNFDVTRQEVKVGVCNSRYVFNATPANGVSFNATAPCPALKRDQLVEDEVLAKEKRDDAKVAELVAGGIEPVHTVYADGGQNPSFASRKEEDVSRPDALATGPVDVAIKSKGKKPTVAQLKAAEAKDLAEANAAAKKAAELRIARDAADAQTGSVEPPAAPATPEPASATAAPAGAGNQSIFTRLFLPKPADQARVPQAQQAAVPAQAAPSADASSSTGMSQMYSATQPSVQPTTADPAAAPGTANVPLPPQH